MTSMNLKNLPQRGKALATIASISGNPHQEFALMQSEFPKIPRCLDTELQNTEDTESSPRKIPLMQRVDARLTAFLYYPAINVYVSDSWIIPPLTLKRTFSPMPSTNPPSFSQFGPATSEYIRDIQRDSSALSKACIALLGSLSYSNILHHLMTNLLFQRRKAREGGFSKLRLSFPLPKATKQSWGNGPQRAAKLWLLHEQTKDEQTKGRWKVEELR